MTLPTIVPTVDKEATIMYGIYKQEPHEAVPTVVAICLTKRGAEKACRHFSDMFRMETCGREVVITFDEIMYYPVLKIGYKALCAKREKEQNKLAECRRKQHIAANNTFAQQCKVADLY